ncbi:hypothetical protein J437_LFUL015643 [Ladona fulva]|uniref:[Histone H3]-trimethyl-L-lysine(4) demethylase n=1 Tax=Ladona fulva TaxID=123851 RepID=A0A8K0P8L3_LADFU|nr:hypothetical protein J437_LFUL015643 [Ladona fulva]
MAEKIPLASKKIHFTPPPEALVYRPTIEEFKDPLAYINRIRPVASKFGICKIVPPDDWQPPFAVNADKLTFSPRIQKLNELEATTRIKLMFFDKIVKFWYLQGTAIKLPTVEGKILDLFSLHKLVQREGGFPKVCETDNWVQLASEMGIKDADGKATLIKGHYEKLLYPYDVFEENKKANSTDWQPPFAVNADKLTFSPRIQKLNELEESQGCSTIGDSGVTQYVLAKYVCVNCGRGDREASLLLCDGCDDSYHTFCLIPSLNSVPKGDWRCPKCVAVVVDKPTEPYGFAQSKRTFTLQEFGAMADEFKSNYFHKPVHHVETHHVESEFWKLVSSIDHDVTVLYGADLHTMDLGSGFPTVNHSELLPCEREYVQSGWNLNNMPVLQRSVLSHINANISGMKVPWMYVGMCFSTFCWHNEDHWSYSINYLHWVFLFKDENLPQSVKEEDFLDDDQDDGSVCQKENSYDEADLENMDISLEIKQELIDDVERQQELGESCSLNPENESLLGKIMKGKRLQDDREYKPTGGKRQIPSRIQPTRSSKRLSDPSSKCSSPPKNKELKRLEFVGAGPKMAGFTKVKVENKGKTRGKKAKYVDPGIKKSELCRFELLPDDERQCEICKTTCFLSAIKCPCSGKRIVCLHHYRELCDCPPENLILRYRYKSHEFIEMLQSLRERFQGFTAWHLKTKKILETPGEKQDISTLTALLQEAIQGQYPSDATFQRLKRALAKAEVIMDLRDKLRVGKYLNQISLECFQEVVDDLNNLPCEIVNSNIILETLEQTLKIQQESRKLLNEEHPDCKELEKCINTMSFTPIELPEFRKLKQKLEQVNWLDEVKNVDREGTLPTLEAIKVIIAAGSQLPPHPHLEGVMSKLQERLTKMENWEKKVTACLEDESKQRLAYLEALLREANNIKGFLPKKKALEEVVKEAKAWFSKVNDIKISPYYPYLQTIEKLAIEGRPMPIKLDVIREMDILMNRAKLWLDKAETTFLRKHAHYTLLEALCPRTKVGISTFRSRKRRNKDDKDSSPCSPSLVPVDEPLSPEDLVTSFKNVENREVELMKALRKGNLAKRANDTGNATYCICQKEFTEGMLQCELCKDYFHAASCVPIIRVPNRIKQQSSLHQLSNSAIKEKFLCPCCMRSRRPRLDAILPLLVGLQELPLRIPEGEALQILTERTMNWQVIAADSLN